MPSMAERKKPSKPKPRRTGVSLGMYLSPEVASALERFVDESRPPTTKTGVVEMLLVQFLEEKGYLKKPSAKPTD